MRAVRIMAGLPENDGARQILLFFAAAAVMIPAAQSTGESAMPKILIVHGAGMNMRGKAQIDVFGPMTLPQYDEHIRKYATELNVDVEIFNSNVEGEVID